MCFWRLGYIIQYTQNPEYNLERTHTPQIILIKQSAHGTKNKWRGSALSGAPKYMPKALKFMVGKNIRKQVKSHLSVTLSLVCLLQWCFYLSKKIKKMFHRNQTKSHGFWGVYTILEVLSCIARPSLVGTGFLWEPFNSIGHKIALI